MKISEAMSIEDLVAMVFDEDDEYSWSSKSEARNSIIRKFNAAQQSVQPTLLESRDLNLFCPLCGGQFDIELPASQRG